MEQMARVQWRQESFLVTSVRRVLEDEHEYASVRVKLSSRGGFGCGQRIGGQNMISLGYEPCSRKRTIHVIALAIDGRIDLVREAIITLVVSLR